jgi:hypothetical protein
LLLTLHTKHANSSTFSQTAFRIIGLAPIFFAQCDRASPTLAASIQIILLLEMLNIFLYNSEQEQNSVEENEEPVGIFRNI